MAEIKQGPPVKELTFEERLELWDKELLRRSNEEKLEEITNSIKNSNESNKGKLGNQVLEKLSDLPIIRNLGDYNENTAIKKEYLNHLSRTGQHGVLNQGLQHINDALGTAIGLPFRGLEEIINTSSDITNIDSRYIGAIKDVILFGKGAKVSKSSPFYRNVQNLKTNIRHGNLKYYKGPPSTSKPTSKTQEFLKQIKTTQNKGLLKEWEGTYDPKVYITDDEWANMVNQIKVDGEEGYALFSMKETTPTQKFRDNLVRSNIPRPDLTKPFRTEPHTATLSESEYKQAWFNYPNHSKEGWNEFQKEHGIFITDTNARFKLKPRGRDFGPILDVSADKPLHIRKMRKELATYIFGGTPLNLDQAKKLAKDQTGIDKYEPHHRTSFGELSPWIDVIAEKLLSPKGSAQYKDGFALMELMKDVMRKQPYFAGDVKENYSLYLHEGHVGPKGIHPRTGWKIDKDTGEQIGYGITGPSSKPSFDFSKISKGVGGIPTKEYLKSLPQTREETLTYVKKIIEKGKVKKKYIKGGELTMEGNTFINTLVEWLKYSDIVKDVAHEELKQASPETIGPNWAKGEK